MVVAALADVLRPAPTAAFAATCKALRTPMAAPLGTLRRHHAAVRALCSDMEEPEEYAAGMGWLGGPPPPRAAQRRWDGRAATLDEARALQVNATWRGHTTFVLNLVLRTSSLPRLEGLVLCNLGLGDNDLRLLCDGLGPAAAPRSKVLALEDNAFGPAGPAALAAAMGRGAWPCLQVLELQHNWILDAGLVALATPLRLARDLRASASLAAASATRAWRPSSARGGPAASGPSRCSTSTATRSRTPGWPPCMRPSRRGPCAAAGPRGPPWASAPPARGREAPLSRRGRRRCPWGGGVLGDLAVHVRPRVRHDVERPVALVDHVEEVLAGLGLEHVLQAVADVLRAELVGKT